jgi:hypothetical protein
LGELVDGGERVEAELGVPTLVVCLASQVSCCVVGFTYLIFVSRHWQLQEK